MTPFGVVLVGFGVLIIVSRGPLVFAPEAMHGFYRKLVREPMWLRALSLLGTFFGLALAWTARAESGVAASGFGALGWVIAVGTGASLLFPAALGRLADSLLQSASDPSLLRAIGVLAIGVGGLVIYFGATQF